MKHLQYILILSVYAIANAQDGKIIEQIQYTLPDSIVLQMEENSPGIKASMSAVNFYRITYLSDDLKVKGYLAIPENEGQYPCIIFNRGGNKEFGKITDHSFMQLAGHLSSQGYIVIASQYRGNDGGEGQEEFGGKDINDVLNLIPLLANLPPADTSRIGMFGWSRGGMMTYIVLTKTTKIKAAVVGSGLTDLIRWPEARPGIDTAVYAHLIPGYTDDKTAVLEARSAVYLAEKIDKHTPVLILQGTADWRVPTDHVLKLVEKFYQVKQPFRFILYEGGQHSLREHRSDYLMQITNWFNTYLRDRKPWPSLEFHGD